MRRNCQLYVSRSELAARRIYDLPILKWNVFQNGRFVGTVEGRTMFDAMDEARETFDGQIVVTAQT